MQSDHNEKIVYKITPCKPLEPCFDLDDYDPCESGDDITEKDLAILLKEEKAKVEGKEELVYNQELEPGYDGIRTAGSVSQKDKYQNKTVNSETVKDRGSTESRDEVAKDRTVRKRICKKPIKNFFFTNRLKFSSDLPPPPPTPPPQFFPPVEETDSKGKIICPKRRKKCKSKTDVEGKAEGGKKKDDKKKTKDERRKNNEGKTKDEERKNNEGKRKDEMRGNDDRRLEGEDDESFRDRKSEDKSEEDESDDSENDSSEQEEHNTARKTENEARWGEDGRRKRKCKKPSERPPCRKKLSEISLLLQPRHIPALQKDLPPTSPKEIPEVKRQILMGCKNSCKVYCRKKKSEKIKN